MAKRACARKKPRAPAPAHLPVSRRHSYTPELYAEGRRRYEQTEDRVRDIAADFGVHPTTFQRMANRDGWVRYVPPPRDLSPAAKLARQVEMLASALSPLEKGRSPAEGGRGEIAASTEATPTLTLPRSGAGDAAVGTVTAADIARLVVSVRGELATVEAMRARMKDEPQRPADADVTARTLARLSSTLRDLQHLQRALPQAKDSPFDADLPADPDAFRDELARRIRAFFAARRSGGDAAHDPAPPADEV